MLFSHPLVEGRLIRRYKRFLRDIQLDGAGGVTAAASKGIALFPDSVSDRGTRHLRELIRLKAQGLRPVQLYCVQRSDVREVRPADGIDYEYGQTLREAIAAGVEVLAYRAKVTPTEIRLE